MKAYKETVRKYYKYSYTSWTRPNISSNGTLGGNSFACSGGVSNPWQCFDGNGGTFGQFYATSESYKTLIFYNPTPIKIYSVGFTYYPSAYIKQATFYGSNNNSTWTEITSFTNSANSNTVNFPSDVNAYKYYKLYITSANGHDGGGGYYIADIYEMTFNAGVQTVIEGTESDYDFYEDVDTYELYKETVRKYYKYGTTPNVTIVGSPTIINGVVSGFSSSNYLTYTSTVSTIASFEQVMKLNITNVNTLQCFTAGDPYKGLGTIQITAAGKLKTYISSNGSSNNIASGTESSLNVPTGDIWIKYAWDGTIYTISVSTNGEDYTNYISVTNSNSPAFNGKIGLGVDTGDGNNKTFLGSIYLNKCYIKINNQDWWRGTLVEESSSSDYDYYEDIDIYKAFNI